METRDIPTGIDDFAKLRDLGLYYVDKSMLIEQVLSRNMTKAFLFTRPRRFGKSLNLSMLDAYLNQDYKGNRWFDGLRISETDRFDSEKNSNVVINLNLKDMGKTYESFINKMRGYIADLYDSFGVLEKSLSLTARERKVYCDIRDGAPSVDMLQFSLKNLSAYLKNHYGRSVIILIDEYDDPINRAEDEAERGRILDFMSIFLSSALKGNKSLRFTVITGVMQIAKEEICSGLNHIDSYSIFDTCSTSSSDSPPTR